MKFANGWDSEEWFYKKFIEPSQHLLTNHSYYVDSGGMIDFLNQFDPKSINKKNIVFFIIEHDCSDDNSFVQNGPTTLQRLKQLVLDNPGQHFWIYCPSINIEQQFNLPNLTIIHWADLVFTHPGIRYATVLPQREKNFATEKHWISLSHNPRIPRYISAMYLLGQNLDATGTITLDPNELITEHESWHHYLYYWKFNKRTEIFKIENTFPILEQGFARIKNLDGFQLFQYKPSFKYNHENFNDALKGMYKNTFVEIINETIVMQPTGAITEKYINSVYGYNLPIILSVAGTVKYLRSIGFNMFDDVIDHSYDLIEHPLERTIAAIKLNLPLLRNQNLARRAWEHSVSKMDQNLELAKELEKNIVVKFQHRLIELNKQLG